MFPASIRVWSVIRQQINTTTSQTIFVIYCRSSIQNYENKKKNSRPKRAGIVLTVSSQQSASGAIRRMYTVCVCVCTAHIPARVIRRAELRDST